MLLELTADMLTIIGGLVVVYIIYLLFIKKENGKYYQFLIYFQQFSKKKDQTFLNFFLYSYKYLLPKIQFEKCLGKSSVKPVFFKLFCETYNPQIR